MATLKYWTEAWVDWWARQRGAGLRALLARRLPEQVLLIALLVWLPQFVGATQISWTWLVGLSAAGLVLAIAVFSGFWCFAGRQL